MEIVENLNRRYIRRRIADREKGEIEGYRIRMIQGNEIPGLVCVDKRCIDGETYLFYDITGLRSMRDLQPGITEAIMAEIVRDMENLLRGLEMYLLKSSEVCLSPEYIWRDEKIGKWSFLYIPDDEGKQSEEVEHLLEFIMDHINCEEENALERFYDFYSNALQSEKLPGVGEIIRLWKKGEEKIGLAEKIKQTLPSQTEAQEVFYIGKNNSVPETENCAEYKERIYSVPFRGIKVSWQGQAALT